MLNTLLHSAGPPDYMHIMAALPQAPPAAIGDPPQNEFLSADGNFAAERGMHPLQNWIFSTHIFWPLALDAHPHKAVGLQVDWGEGLDKFALLSSAADDASKEEIARELLLQLEGLLADGSVGNAALLVWAYFIQAIDRQLAEGADLLRLLGLLGGFLSGSISPLFQDAAAYCGCAMVSHWATAVAQQAPSQDATAVISAFHSVITALVKVLGRDGQRLLKEGKQCLDPSSHSGCRAAALAYSSHRAALDLRSCPAFPYWREVLKRVLEAGFGLPPLFGAPTGELLPTWQLAALQRLLPLFREPQSIVEEARGASAEEENSKLEILGGCQLVMPGCIETLAALTQPYKVAVLEPEREGAALQAEEILHHLVASTRNMRFLVEDGLYLDVFLEHGIPIVLYYLSTYAQLQPSLPWVHPAHVVAVEAETALMSLLTRRAQQAQGEQPEAIKEYRRLQRVILESGAVDSLLAVVGSAPSISETIRHFQGDDPWLADDMRTAAAARQPAAPSSAFGAQPEPSAPPTAMAAGAAQEGQQPGPQWRTEFIHRGVFRFDAIRYALQLLESLGRYSSAWRELLLQTDCATVLIKGMTHLQEGMPLGAVERQSLPPVAEWIVWEWTGRAIGVLAGLVAPLPPLEADSEAGKREVRWSRVMFGQLKNLLTPADLVGLLRWRAQPAGTPESGGQDSPPSSILEGAVLLFTLVMVVTWPGVSKDLEREKEFMQYLEGVLVGGSLRQSSTLVRQEVDRRCFVLTILADMIKHCESTRIAARFLHAAAGGPAGSRIVDATLSTLAQALTYGRKLEVEWIVAVTGRLRQLEDMRDGMEACIAHSTVQLGLAASLAVATADLLEALLRQGTPRLRLEAGRIKAAMERLSLQRAATVMQDSPDTDFKKAALKALACIKRVEDLAELGRQQAQQRDQQEARRQEVFASLEKDPAVAAAAAAAAAEAAAAALLAEEEAAQQASAVKATKRQRQKAAKQAQQAAAAAERQERERQEQEEQEQQERVERERKEQEKAQKAAEAAAAALQAEHEMAQRRAAAKAAKRQRKRAAKQAQQQGAGDSTAGAAAGAANATSQPSSSTTSVAAARSRTEASPPCDAPSFGQQASQQGLAAAAPKNADLVVHGSWHDHQQQERQQEAGQAAAEPLVPSSAQVTIPAQVGTPEVKEGRGALAPAVDDQDAEFKALLSLLIPGAAVEPTMPIPTAPPPGGPGSGSIAPLQQAQQQGTERAPALAAVLRCALSGQQLQDPVVAADGWTYEREAITAWLAAGEITSPVTGQPLGGTVLRPNYALRQLLDGDL